MLTCSATFFDSTHVFLGVNQSMNERGMQESWNKFGGENNLCYICANLLKTYQKYANKGDRTEAGGRTCSTTCI